LMTKFSFKTVFVLQIVYIFVDFYNFWKFNRNPPTSSQAPSPRSSTASAPVPWLFVRSASLIQITNEGQDHSNR
jgi:hypothetical protein